jgi:hypothetical protein
MWQPSSYLPRLARGLQKVVSVMGIGCTYIQSQMTPCVVALTLSSLCNTICHDVLLTDVHVISKDVSGIDCK